MYLDRKMAHAHVSTVSTSWETLNAVSVWDGRGTCVKFTTAWAKDKDDYVKVKVHRKSGPAKQLPTDIAGWELLGTTDEDAEGTIGQATISKDYQRGRHRIFKVPAHGPLGKTPP